VREEVRPRARPRLIADIRGGIRATLGHPLLRPLIVSVGISNFWDSAANTVFLVYAVRELGLSTTALGLVLGAGSVGAIAGSMVSTRLVRRFGLGRTIMRVAVIASAASFLLLIPSDAGIASIILLVAAFAGWTMCDAIYSIQSVSIRQSATPQAMRGRVSSTGWLFVFGSLPLGAITGGALGELIGLRLALAVSLIGMLPALVVLLRSPVVRLTGMPEVDERYWSRFA
jgi:MFS family permease